MLNFASFSEYFASTLGIFFLATLTTCATPNRDILKHLSRLIWVSSRSRGPRKDSAQGKTPLTADLQVGWCGMWMTGVVGVVTFLTGETYLSEDW